MSMTDLVKLFFIIYYGWHICHRLNIIIALLMQ